LDQQPNPTLDIAPKDKTGKAGDLIGPFVVTTTADKIEVKAALDGGAKLTDKDGKELSEVKSGEFAAESTGDKVTEIYVKVPAEAKKGEAKFTVEVDAELKTGRLFIRSDSNHKTQSLVVASPVTASVKADAKANWEAAPETVPTVPSETSSSTPTSTTTTAPTTTTTPAPVAGGGSDDNLASTGASIFVPLLIGIGLLGAGAGALLLIRRRKAAA
jgi:LPXTG-motif cell wall-anchored protein